MLQASHLEPKRGVSRRVIILAAKHVRDAAAAVPRGRVPLARMRSGREGRPVQSGSRASSSSGRGGGSRAEQPKVRAYLGRIGGDSVNVGGSRALGHRDAQSSAARTPRPTFSESSPPNTIMELGPVTRAVCAQRALGEPTPAVPDARTRLTPVTAA
jgi:hypothetical protein